MKSKLLLGALFVFTVGCDQASKAMVATLPPGGVDVIPGFMKLVYAENPGAAFSGFLWLPASSRALILTLIGVVMMVAVSVALWRTPERASFTRPGYVLVIAGGLGNMIDRVRFGHVVDFVLWHVGRFSWPVFNVADVALVLGVALLLLPPKLAD